MIRAALLTLLLTDPAPSPPVPVPIYVGPQVRDGFLDVDKGLRDSVKDLRWALRRDLRTGRKDASFQLVEDESAADVKVFVAERTTAPGPIRRLRVLLRAGSYEREFVAERHVWQELARLIAKDLSVWFAANRERLLKRQ